MATRVISTSIKLDGEAEFKKQLSNVNGELKNLKSDMQLVSAEFDGQANSLEALTAKDKILRAEFEQQQEKVRALAEALEETSEAYGENDRRVDGYRRQLNQAKVDLIKMERALQDNDRYMDEARRSTDKAAHSIDGFGKEAKDAAGGMDSMGGGVKDFISKIGGIKGAIVGGAVVGSLVAVKDAIMGVVESTAEYRKIMGTLEISSQNAGYTALETEEAYRKLYSVLGDTQTAATTVANLQAIGMEQDDLMKVVNASIGAWATYGDSIPIDGLAEAINETIKAGQVTGVFADVLNWAGVSEDEFNAKLEAASTQGQRQNIVLQELARQGLAEAGRGWIEANEDIVAMNAAQADWEEATGRLGEALAPAATALVTFGTGAVQVVTDMVIAASAAIEEFIQWFDKMSQKVDTADEWNGAPTWGFEENAVRNATPFEIAGANTNTKPAATSQDVYNAAAAGVNAMMSPARNGGKTTIEVNMVVDGKKFYQETIDDLRFVEKSNPEARNDG